MGTDELRELLERYPELDGGELRRLRELYRGASATDVMAILACPGLGPKARRLDPPADIAWDRLLVILSVIVAAAIAAYLVMQPQ